MRRTVHRSIALLAAYALALQAVLAVFAVAAPRAGAASTSLCRGDPGAPVTPPAHDPCDACLAGHCAASDTPERAAFAARWPAALRIAPTPLRAVSLTALAPELGPHAPRAPPAG